jgi:hypothetical protein
MRLLSVAQCVESSRWKAVRAFTFSSTFFNTLWASSPSTVALSPSLRATFSIRFVWNG